MKENELCSWKIDGSGAIGADKIIQQILDDKFKDTKVYQTSLSGHYQYRIHVCVKPSDKDLAIYALCRGIASHLTASRPIAKLKLTT